MPVRQIGNAIAMSCGKKKRLIALHHPVLLLHRHVVQPFRFLVVFGHEFLPSIFGSCRVIVLLGFPKLHQPTEPLGSARLDFLLRLVAGDLHREFAAFTVRGADQSL